MNGFVLFVSYLVEWLILYNYLFNFNVIDLFQTIDDLLSPLLIFGFHSLKSRGKK